MNYEEALDRASRLLDLAIVERTLTTDPNSMYNDYTYEEMGPEYIEALNLAVVTVVRVLEENPDIKEALSVR